MSALPAALAPWSESLAALDARLAVDLGPLVRRLDELVTRLDDPAGELGEPDGYDGTTNRGHPDALLVEEWLLAEEVPLEFLRRAAEGELRYLHTARRDAAPRGRVVAVVDSGPEQVGAGRLVQLAALVVLDRRARATGSELTVVDAQSGRRVTGGLEVVLPVWLRFRSALAPDVGAVDEVLRTLDRGDAGWVLAGAGLARDLPSHRRLLTSRPAGWTDDGVDRVEVRVGVTTTRLSLPPARRSIAALRGQGLLAAPTPHLARSTSGFGSTATFTSAASSLLWRGADVQELHRLPVSVGRADGPEDARRAKRYPLPAAVLSAAVIGRRTVALVTDGVSVWGHVIGKTLAAAASARASTAELGLTPDVLDELMAGPLPPVQLWGGGLLVRLPSGWWVLSAQAPVRYDDLRAVAPGPQLDAPRMVWAESSGRGPRGVPDDHQLLLGPVGWWVASADGTDWFAHGPAGRPGGLLRITAGHEALGLTLLEGVPALVTRSRSGEGRLLKVTSDGVDRTLTSWAGPASYSLHPTRPWLARATDGDVGVLDLATGQVVIRVRLES